MQFCSLFDDAKWISLELCIVNARIDKSVPHDLFHSIFASVEALQAAWQWRTIPSYFRFLWITFFSMIAIRQR
jgi:hypothetical protein